MFLSCQQLHKSFGTADAKSNALNDLNLEVNAGEICIVLGPSGCGKSTLLHVIGGLEPTDCGSITVDGSAVSSMHKKELTTYRRETVGFVFQNYQLIPDLTVYENVEVCRCLSSHPLDMDTLLQTLGIADKVNRFPRELSGGQQQRVAIARAVVKNPKLLLCDEPTGALDSCAAREILSLLFAINRRYGTTIVLVTHNEAIIPMGHRVVRMRDGAVTEQTVNPAPTDPATIAAL